jgi:hypothetical protein
LLVADTDIDEETLLEFAPHVTSAFAKKAKSTELILSTLQLLLIKSRHILNSADANLLQYLKARRKACLTVKVIEKILASGDSEDIDSDYTADNLADLYADMEERNEHMASFFAVFDVFEFHRKPNAERQYNLNIFEDDEKYEGNNSKKSKKIAAEPAKSA